MKTVTTGPHDWVEISGAEYGQDRWKCTVCGAFETMIPKPEPIRKFRNDDDLSGLEDGAHLTCEEIIAYRVMKS